MSDDNWQHKSEYKPGVEEAGQQIDRVDAVEGLLAFMPFGFGRHVNAFGSTDFENHDLNDMIDLVEHAQPEHLEAAGKALWDAHKAISEAATDLRTHLKQVDWQGQAATDFHTWAGGLADWSDELATFADKSATQISAASMGLATVKKSMPPRDSRPHADRKLPTELPKAKQVDSNPDYVAAKQAEKHRQEAINQMNKLASYYAVSAGSLEGEEGPKPYQAMPSVGVPKPSLQGSDDRASGASERYGSTHSAPIVAGAVSHHVQADTTDVRPAHHNSPVKEVHPPVLHPGHQVGTEINATGTLPPPVHTAQPAPSAPTLPAAGGGQTPPMTSGPMAPPIAPTVGRAAARGPAGRLPISAQGRTGASGAVGGRVPQGSESQTGRAATGGRVPQEPMGQAARATGRSSAPTGQSPVRGSTPQGGRSPLGRGVTGGTPRMTNTPVGRAGAGPVSAARNGVVGGKPVTGRTAGTGPKPRVPRGTVVGAEEPTSSQQPRSGLGQRGVVGAQAAKRSPRTGQSLLRSAGSPEGAIGTPRKNGGFASGDAESGTTAGLGRGAVGERQAPDGGTGRAGGPMEKEQRRSSRKKRRDGQQKSD
ncbi:hypothetical protein NX794_32915 [Streptomyces sp. LP11]|uniref:Uncharacterized protein n=1 Tax=Streptomyces pyxinicus TaxID=2970331 RepID=A0ABT2BDI3_9ACTN|nr:hypothetical protein [Streptomyces sp. LP11]MCS0605973.1 hypothetical protein [Streptomyces sp. LP11]